MESKHAAIAVTVGILLGLIFKEPTNDRYSQGDFSDEMEAVKRKFDEILKHEREGAAMAVYHNNEMIVDLWGGYAERGADRVWERDTMTVTFSTTKAIAALIMAIFVSRGNFHYDDLVTKYWPEFGQYGKENVTIQWILDHKAGLIKFDGEIKLEQGNDHAYIAKLIEQTKPKWPPGTICGYHGITQGWLIDQIVRRTDPKRRGIGEFYREEIQPFMKDKDFYIGLPRALHYRVARLEPSKLTEVIKAFALGKMYRTFLWNYLKLRDNFTESALNYPEWMSVLRWGTIPYNNPYVREVENVAALGIGTARGLASAALTIMERNMISDEVWKILSEPREYSLDHVAKVWFLRGYGFIYEKHPTRKDRYLLTHSGHGVQRITIDPVTKTTISFIRNLIRWDEASMSALADLDNEVLKRIDQ